MQGYAAAADRLVQPVGQVRGLGGVDDRAEIEVRQRVVVGLDGERVTELHAPHHRQVRLEEPVEQLTLHDVARVSGAALLGVLEALLEVRRRAAPTG